MDKSKLIRLLFHHLKRGKLAFFGQPFFMTLVTIELWLERMVDTLYAKKMESDLVNQELTAVIKTFERPKALKRLVQSIRRFYPKMKVIVVDDSRKPTYIEGVQTVVMPFDSGVSAGRNRGLEEVTTKYVLLLDDDYVFYRKSTFDEALMCMDACSEIDIMGGERVDLPLYRKVDYKKSALFPTMRKPLKPTGSLVCSMPVYDKVANFYIARTERLRLVGWDANLKRLDHSDFFTRAKGVLVTVFNKKFKVLHAQTPDDEFYMKRRFSLEEDRLVLTKKYYG